MKLQSYQFKYIGNFLRRAFVTLVSKAARRLPPRLFLWYASILYPLFYLRLPDLKIRFALIEESLISLAIRGTNNTNFFYSPYRAIRYVLGGGFTGLGEDLAKRYQLHDLSFSQEDIVIEVGANIGELTSWFINKSVKKVFCFEIDPLALRCLRLNCPKATVIECAASDYNGEARIYLDSAGASTSLLGPINSSDNVGDCQLVKTQRLDQFISEYGFKSIKLIKIEAEGCEPEVLRGIGNNLNFVQYVAIDAGPERLGRPTVDEVCRILASYQFSVRIKNYYVLGFNERFK